MRYQSIITENILAAVDKCLNGIFERSRYADAVLPLALVIGLDAVSEDNRSESSCGYSLRDAVKRHSADMVIGYCRALPESVREILDHWRFEESAEKLASSKILISLIEEIRAAGFDTRINREQARIVFEELACALVKETRRIPSDIAGLLAGLLTAQASHGTGNECSVYDAACGTGAAAAALCDKLALKSAERGKNIRIRAECRESDPESLIIAKALSLLSGNTDGMSFSPEAPFEKDVNRQYDFIISVPTRRRLGKDERVLFGNDPHFERSLKNGETLDAFRGTNDGQLPYLMDCIAKMDPEHGTRAVHIHSASLLLSGDAGSAECFVRRYLIENDLIEAVILLPRKVMHSSDSGSVILLLSSRKEERRRGKIQLINASSMKAALYKSGKKKCIVPADKQKDILHMLETMENSGHSRVINNDKLLYYLVTVERPLRKRVVITPETIKETVSMFKVFYGVDTDDGDMPEVAPQDIFTFSKRNPKVRSVKMPKTWEAVQLEAVYNIYMHILLDMMRNEPYNDYNAFLEQFYAHPLHRKNPTNFTYFERFMYTITEKDDSAEAVIVNKKIAADPELRISVKVPRTYGGGIDGYFKDKILPDYPDAWINSALTKEGCEISFGKYFALPQTRQMSDELLSDAEELGAAAGKMISKIVLPGVPKHTTRRELPLERIASVQRIQNTALAERALLTLEDGKTTVSGTVDGTSSMPRNYEKYQIVYPGNIILRLFDIGSGKTMPRTGLVTEKGIVSPLYTCLTVSDSVLPEYLRLQLHIADISGTLYTAGGGVGESLCFGDIAHMNITVLSLEEQAAAISEYNRVSAAINTASEKLGSAAAALRELKDSVIYDILGI